MQSGRNTFGPACCPRRMRPKCNSYSGAIWISVFCSIQPAIRPRLEQINASTVQLQTGLWLAVQAPGVAQPTPVIALAVSGMNDVLNSQGYTQAAWWNRIPVAAWGLMGAIAICAVALVGFGARRPKAESKLLLVLPLVVAIAFFLISDIDSPRRGLIHVKPQNLLSLVQSLRAQ